MWSRWLWIPLGILLATATVAGCAAGIWPSPDRIEQARQTVAILMQSGRVAATCTRIKEGCITALHVANGLGLTPIKADEALDLALLGDVVGPVAPVGLVPPVGTWVFLVWAPYGLPLVTPGLIASHTPRDTGQVAVATTFAGPGGSGGGVFDRRGHLVAVAQALPTFETPFFTLPQETLVFSMPVSRWLPAED